MLSKNTLKFIKSLQQKKFRKLEHAFFVEGSKNVTELLQSDYESTHLIYTERYYQDHFALVDNFRGESYLVSQKILESAGAFKTNDSALAVAKTKANDTLEVGSDEWVIALDDVRDPGNLGTIIRIADWYGIRKIILSEESADFYNPKVLQSSMGSFTRAQVWYTSLIDFIQKSENPVYGAFLNGTTIYQTPFAKGGILLMGNESKGISAGLEPLVTHKVTIPRVGQAESLNVAIATAIFCDNIIRSNS